MKRTFGLVTFVLTCLAVGSRLASAQVVDPAFSKDALRLMTMTGSDKLAEQLQSIFLTQMLQQFRKDYPNLPERAVAIVSEVVINAFRKRINGPDGLLQMMVPLYAQHFTHADIVRMIEFYESDLGRKFVSAMPSITQDGMAIGAKWGDAVRAELVIELESRLRAEFEERDGQIVPRSKD